MTTYLIEKIQKLKETNHKGLLDAMQPFIKEGTILLQDDIFEIIEYIIEQHNTPDLIKRIIVELSIEEEKKQAFAIKETAEKIQSKGKDVIPINPYQQGGFLKAVLYDKDFIKDIVMLSIVVFGVYKITKLFKN